MNPFKVNEKCIGCVACARVAKDTFEIVGRKAIVKEQPDTPEKYERALLAMKACPVDAIELEIDGVSKTYYDVEKETEKTTKGKSEKPSLTIQSATPVGYPIIMKLLESEKLKSVLTIETLKVWTETEKHLAWIANGKADISFSAVITATKFQNDDVKMPAVFVWNNFVLLTRKPGVKNFSDLKGETLYMPLFEDAPPAKIARYLLESEGLEMADFTFKYGEPFGRPHRLMEAFISGEASHVLLREPEASFALAGAQAKGFEFSEVRFDTLFNQVNPGFGLFPNAGVMVKSSLYEAYPEAMAVFEAELKSAIQWVTENPKAAAQLAHVKMERTVEEVTAFIKRAHFDYIEGEALTEHIKNFYSILSKTGILPMKVTPKLMAIFKK